MNKTNFFTKDKSFYKVFFKMMLIISLQNIVAYSVNMIDNVMLGSYSQTALSGAAAVNQIFFIIQQTATAIGESLVILSSQYWGQKKTGEIRKVAGMGIKYSFIFGLAVLILSSAIPGQLISIFTKDAGIINSGQEYLSIVKYSFILFVITNTLISTLRSVEIVKISFFVSAISLVINTVINYTLIFGKFGLSELGIKGAAIGTVLARTSELIIILIYLLKDKRLKLLNKENIKNDLIKCPPLIRKNYAKITFQVMLSQLLWAISVPIQSAVLGRLSSDAFAANSLASTFYQYLKVIVLAISAASSVVIGISVGKGDIKRAKSDARTLSVIDILTGIVLAGAMLLIKDPLLKLYNLSDNAMLLADHIIIILSVLMIGMSYQMPVSTGIMRAGGDVNFTVYLNIICMWVIVLPLSFMAAFWWKWPIEAVVIMLQSDQIFKCLPVFLHFRNYKWIKKLT